MKINLNIGYVLKIVYNTIVLSISLPIFSLIFLIFMSEKIGSLVFLIIYIGIIFLSFIIGLILAKRNVSYKYLIIFNDHFTLISKYNNGEVLLYNCKMKINHPIINFLFSFLEVAVGNQVEYDIELYENNGETTGFHISPIAAIKLKKRISKDLLL